MDENSDKKTLAGASLQSRSGRELAGKIRRSTDAPEKKFPRKIKENGVSSATQTEKRSCLGTAFAVFGILISTVYLMNLGLGVFWEIPDNIPFFGNLDEAFFTTLLLGSLAYLGIKIPFFKR